MNRNFAHLTNAQVRKALDSQYAQNAVNERYVAQLRYEMTLRNHRHVLIDSLGTDGARECLYCFAGTDQYFMSLDDIMDRVAESEKVQDAAVAQIARPVHKAGGSIIGDPNGKYPNGIPYGTTHDMDCPGCEGTSFLTSPRSETYWAS